MNNIEIEQCLSRDITLLELLAGKVAHELEASDHPESGHQICGTLLLKDAATADLAAVLQFLSHRNGGRA